jgi:hypothetical protein
MKTNLDRTITTQDEAEDFLNELFENGESFHPEDSAHEIVWASCPTPTHNEMIKLNNLMNATFHFDGFDPCEYLEELREEEDRRMKLARPSDYDSEEKAFRDRATYSERNTDDND